MDKSKKTGQGGFSLLEILAVIAIIGILASFITPRVSSAVVEAQEKACLANVKYLEGIIERYKLSQGRYPSTLAELNQWYKDEYPVSPRTEKNLTQGQTGYYFNPSNGKVVAHPENTSGLVEIRNETG